MENKTEELLTSIEKKLDENKTSSEQMKKDFETQLEKKFADAKTEADKSNQKVEDDMKQIHEDMAKKGATLEDIQKELKAFKAKAGRFSAGENPADDSTVKVIQDLMAEKFDKIRAMESKSLKLETKTVGVMTAANNLTAGAVTITYDGVPAVRGRRKVNFRDLVSTINSSTGLYSFYRQGIPVGEGSVDYQSAIAAAKNQIDYDWAEVQTVTKYLSGYARLAKQFMQDLTFLQNTTAQELVEDYLRAESQVMFTQLASDAAGSTTTGASVYAEKLIDWIATLMGTDYTPTAIVTTPANWATLLKTKPNDYSIPGGVTISAAGDILFVGIPVIPQNNVAAGKTFVGDFTKANIIQTDALSLQFFEQDQDNVIKNLITARVEARVNLATKRTDAFIYA